MNIKRNIDKCSKGNRKAQKAFYDQYINLFYATINRYVKDESTVDDILFRSMMKVFEKLKDFKYINEPALIAWLKKVAINESLMHLRSDFRTVYKIEEISENNVNELVDADELSHKDILKTIDQLPSGYRTVFLLNVVDGYSHKEIAERLEIAEGTSRSQFFKARNILRQKLEQDYGKEYGT